MDLYLSLHAHPSCITLHDISIIDPLAHSSICLFRHFIAKLGGYIIVDWSFMVFGARHGTQNSIKTEPFFIRYIELYVINPKNMNCFLFDKEETYRNVDEVEPRVYVIHEPYFTIPNMIQGEKE